MGSLTRSTMLLLMTLAAPVYGQAWPSKPIRVVVNVPPGSSVDVVARIFAPPLGETLGQPVLVDYRAGGAGNVGVEMVARSAPDGHTLLASAGGTILVNPHLYKLSFDMEKDLDPVAATARPAILLVVRPGLQVSTVRELVDQMRANPGKLNFGSPGSGTGLHIAAEMMLHLSKTRATHVPYKGAAQMLSDLLGNQFDFMFDPGPAIPHIRTGKIRLLAVANAARSPLFPDTPTLAETGLDIDVGFPHGVYAPAGTPRSVIGRLNREIVRIMQRPESVSALTTIAAVPLNPSAEEFTEQLRRMRERFGVIVREANIKPD
jgi:tripartite-type tricarboxylate transporter receptor subunit TctC